jgi:hypothetical protein
LKKEFFGIRYAVLVLISAITASVAATQKGINVATAEDGISPKTSEIVLGERRNRQQNNGRYG